MSRAVALADRWLGRPPNADLPPTTPSALRMECVLSAPPAGVVKRDTSVADGRFFSQTWPDERRAGVVSRVQVECGGVVRVDAKRLKHQEPDGLDAGHRSEEHTSELQSLMR